MAQIIFFFLGKITRRLALDRLRKENHIKRGCGQVSLAFEELADCLSDEGGEHFTLRFVLGDFIDYGNGRSDAEKICELGSVKLSRTEQNVQIHWFPEPVVFENGAYGKGEFLGIELSAAGVK